MIPLWDILPVEIAEYIAIILTSDRELVKAMHLVSSSKALYTFYNKRKQKIYQTLDWINNPYICSIMKLKGAKDPYYFQLAIFHAHSIIQIKKNYKLSQLDLSMYTSELLVPVIVVSAACHLYIDMEPNIKLFIVGSRDSCIHLSGRMRFKRAIFIDNCTILSAEYLSTSLEYTPSDNRTSTSTSQSTLTSNGNSSQSNEIVFDNMHNTFVLSRCIITIPIYIKQGACIMRRCICKPDNLKYNSFNSEFIKMDNITILHLYDSFINGSTYGITLYHHTLAVIMNTIIIGNEKGCTVGCNSSLLLENTTIEQYSDTGIVIADDAFVQIIKSTLSGTENSIDINCVSLHQTSNTKVLLKKSKLLSNTQSISSLNRLTIKVDERTIIKGKVPKYIGAEIL